MRHYFSIIIISLILCSVVFFLYKQNTPATVQINGKNIKVEVARTTTERAKGLSSRNSLVPDTGMLFVFDKADLHSFWMKDMLFPLDIIYINNGKVAETTTLQPPSDNNIPKYTPQNKAQYVLELNVNSGFKVGDEVKIKY